MKVKREDFLKALTFVQPGLAAKEVIEHTNSFVFHRGRVMTFNDEVSVQYPLPEEIKHLEGAVKAKELLGLVSRYRSAEIDVEMTEGEFRVKTKTAGAGVVCEATLPDFADELKIPETDAEWDHLPENFAKAVRFCTPSVGSDMTVPALACIHFVDDRAESTDTYRMAIYDLNETVENEFLLPGFVCKNLSKHKFSSYNVQDGWLHLRTAEDKVVFSTRTFEPEFPDLLRHLAIRGKSFTLPDGLGGAIEKACVFVQELDFESDRVVEIAVKEGGMRVSSKGPNGWFKEVLKSEYKGDPFKFSVNPIWLMEAYALLRSCEVTDAHIRLEGTDFIHMIMLSTEAE